jgi:Protein of unknown function (DUF3047)
MDDNLRSRLFIQWPARFLLYCYSALAIPDPLAATLPIGNFSGADLEGWNPERFSGETIYRLTLADSGRTVLCAESRGTASGLVREVSVDLRKTPYLNWSWQVEGAFLEHDEKTRAGDDYPARVYVVVNDGLFFWQTIALNYVWAGRAPSGSLWISPYISDNVKLLAVESGNGRRGRWQHEKRNVMEDLKSAFGRSITRIDAVAIMTDTDNTGAHGKACYGDIFFSSD